VADEIYESEMERIFAERWICVGRAEQVKARGQYFLYTMGPESIIVLRDHTGCVRAYYNVCRHRGTRLCENERGSLARTIQCPYHAWTYALDGRLVGLPDAYDMPEISKEDYPLHRVTVHEWEGFLFINLDPEPEPFGEAFKPVLERFASWKISSLRSVRRVEYDVKANWKLVVQNYSECYHCPLIHPALNQLSSHRTGADDLAEGTVLGGYMELSGEAQSMSVGGDACAPPLPGLADTDLNRVYYYSLFPNMLLSLHPDYVMFHLLQPQSPSRTRVVCEWLFDPATASAPGFDPKPAVEFWDMTNRQDWHACELSQLGVSSRAYTPGPYHGWQEKLLAEFDRQVLLALEDTPI
jgi:Rieske 2Fe-2S family protein